MLTSIGPGNDDILALEKVTFRCVGDRGELFDEEGNGRHGG